MQAPTLREDGIRRSLLAENLVKVGHFAQCQSLLDRVVNLRGLGVGFPLASNFAMLTVAKSRQISARLLTSPVLHRFRRIRLWTRADCQQQPAIIIKTKPDASNTENSPSP